MNQNYPNPFNPLTTISYSLAEASFVRIDVFSMNGKLMGNLVNSNHNAGDFSFSYNGENLPTGVYMIRMQSGSFIQTRKMTLMK